MGCLFSSLLRSMCEERKKKKDKNARKIFSHGFVYRPSCLSAELSYGSVVKRRKEPEEGIKADGMRQAVNFNDVVLFLIGSRCLIG